MPSISEARVEVQRAYESALRWADTDEPRSFWKFEQELWALMLAVGRAMVALFLVRQAVRPRALEYRFDGRRFVLAGRHRTTPLGTLFGKVPFHSRTDHAALQHDLDETVIVPRIDDDRERPGCRCGGVAPGHRDLENRREIRKQPDRHHDVVTADFAYIRWLGDRKATEAITQRWDRLVIDRRQDTAASVAVVRQLLARKLPVYGFYNNHYAGHSPGSIALFYELWQATRAP